MTLTDEFCESRLESKINQTWASTATSGFGLIPTVGKCKARAVNLCRSLRCVGQRHFEMSSSYCGFGNLLLPLKSLTGTDAMADNVQSRVVRSCQHQWSFHLLAVKCNDYKQRICIQPGALRPLDTASKHGSAHALADQDVVVLSQAAAAFDAFFLT